MPATPKAAELARDLGAPIDDVPGTGKGRRVTVADVRRWAKGPGALPDDLDGEAKRQYAALVVSITPNRHAREQLLELVRRDQDARECRTAMSAQGRFHVSDSGRVYAHPGIELEREARRDVARLTDELGLGPEAPAEGEQDSGDEFDL